MHCPSADSVFLRANGNFVCWDDAGSDTVLQRYKPEKDISRIFSSNGPCALIAKKLSQDTLPFSETCPGCYCLSLRGSPRFNSRVLNVMQVEPSSRCTLQCKACAKPEERKKLQLPDTLSPTVFQKVLQDFSTSRIDIRTFDFSGHGEPLMNPDLWDLISIARKYYPDAFISLITNAHGNFEERHITAGLDQIQFSIDGTCQESYEKYRVGGNFVRASSYMESFSKNAGSSVRTVWRYILFNHNDRPDQIKDAYQIAFKYGINELRFIFTHKGMWSTDLTSSTELRRCLTDTGVPSRSIHMDSFKTLRLRQKLGQLLKQNHKLYGTARKHWRMAKRGHSHDTVVTSDFYQLNKPELLKTLNLGLKFLSRGRLKDAETLFRHVDKLIQSPSTHNTTYDPEIIRKHLGSSYEKLKDGLSNCSAGSEM